MPVFSFKCTNVQCSNYGKIIKRIVYGFSSKGETCEICNNPLERVYQFGGNINIADGSQNVGKVIKEKNESLKKKWEGYSWEQKSLRQKITEITNNLKETK